MKRLFFLFTVLVLFRVIVFSVEFKFIDYSTEDNRVYVEVEIGDIFSNDALDSLENGQEIKIYLNVKLFEKRVLFPDKKIKESGERNLIQYNIITQKFHVVIGKSPGNRDETFLKEREEAFEMISRFKKLPVFNRNDINISKDYKITIEIKIVSLKMSLPISLIFDFFFDLNYSVSKSFEYSGAEILEKYFN
ncbi:MAG TPA: DUF4390 domain-containing protein [Firmicutes bacterium]|nr:DUF4390 domain-containing protein [Bacillota bacterium]